MSIEQLMTDTVHRAPFDSLDDNADPTYGAVEKIDARIEYDSTVTRGREDQSSINTRDVFMTAVEVSDDDIIWLPGQDTSDTANARAIHAVQTMQAHWNGKTYSKVILE